MIERSIPLIDEILGEHSVALESNLEGYKNHVYRMVHFCLALADFSADERRKILIAGCFHDIGIWTAGTFDYLPPSIELAAAHLNKCGLGEWETEISEMIGQHHKLRQYAGSPMVECFRKGDLVDFSLGLFRCGIAADYVREVKGAFPNSGFHRRLVSVAGRWFCRHPLKPVPVGKW